MQEACKGCNHAQVRKVAKLVSLSEEKKRLLEAKVDACMEDVDKWMTNPEVMGKVWPIITKAVHKENPYKEIKSYYNKEVEKLLPQIEQLIKHSENALDTALKVVITGNLIDFGAMQPFSMELLTRKLKKVTGQSLAIDDSSPLFTEIRKAKTVLYLGDNCGEIVLDKLFIKLIKQENPECKMYYGVRGRSIVNDVTIEDAAQVRMEEVAEVIANGNGDMGTVLAHASYEFKKIFEHADLIIAKGQGNFESLLAEKRDSLYFLFMVKCETIAKIVGAPVKGIVCYKKEARES